MKEEPVSALEEQRVAMRWVNRLTWTRAISLALPPIGLIRSFRKNCMISLRAHISAVTDDGRPTMLV
jgi:hypothetical protein